MTDSRRVENRRKVASRHRAETVRTAAWMVCRKRLSAAVAAVVEAVVAYCNPPAARMQVDHSLAEVESVEDTADIVGSDHRALAMDRPKVAKKTVTEMASWQLVVWTTGCMVVDQKRIHRMRQDTLGKGVPTCRAN